MEGHTHGIQAYERLSPSQTRGLPEYPVDENGGVNKNIYAENKEGSNKDSNVLSICDLGIMLAS